MWIPLAVSPRTDDNSPEAIEKLRLECFITMLHMLGLRTRLTWHDTQYQLVIQRPRQLWWPFRRTVQTLSRDIVPSKPFAEHWWSPPTDCYTEAALTSLYQGALECALGAHHISLELSDSVRYAVHQFQTNLAEGLQAFPVRHEQNDGRFAFWVVSAKPLTDKDYEFADFIWPSVQLHVSDDEEYAHIRTYVHFFIERYFGGVRSPYGEIIGCGCLDELELEEQP